MTVPIDDVHEGGGADRRRVLTLLSVGAGAAAAALVGIPLLGFIVAPLFSKPQSAWRSVGRVEQFEEGQTVEVSFRDASPESWAGVTAKTAAWLRRNGKTEFIAFSVNCTHLGCPVRWVADADLFMCPCHGGVYYADGKVAGGPPPLPLRRYPLRIRNGEVEIRTSPIPIT